MSSEKNKVEISPLNKSKNKKYAKACKKKQYYDPTSKYNSETQSCTIEGNMTTNDSILNSTTQKAIRKRKANGDITQRKIKIKRIKCNSTIIQEPGPVSDLLERVSNSGSVDTSEAESYSTVKMSPSNKRTVKKNNTSELCNENILSVSDDKLHPLSFPVQPKSPVVYIPLISNIANSDVSVIATESNLDITEASMPYSTSTLENDLSETRIHDMIFGSSISLENVNPVVESLNTNSDFELLLHPSTNDNEQNIVENNKLLKNNINPIHYDITKLLVSKLNEVKDSKENFICSQLNIKPVIKPGTFKYEDSNVFNIAFDVSTLKAANDYIKEIPSVSDDILPLSTDVILENADTWQDSLVKSNNFTPDIVKYVSGDSNDLYPENVKNTICVNTYNENLSHNLDECTLENLNNVGNFLQYQDLNVDSNEINKENSQNSSEDVDLLTENNSEKFDKLCTTVKRRKKKLKWNHKKRGHVNKISPPKVSELSNEISYFDETDVCENIDIATSDINESVDLNSASSPAQVLTQKTHLTNTVTENNKKNYNTIITKDKKIACMVEAKCMDVAKNTKSNLEIISQNSGEDALSIDRCNEIEQCSTDQAKQFLLENSVDIVPCNKSSSELPIDCDISNRGEKCINPKRLSKESDNLEINKINLITKCNISHEEEKNVAKLGLTSEGKEFKLLEGLIVGLEKLDEDTLSKYCATTSIQGKDTYCTQHENSEIAFDVGTTELSCSNSDNTCVPSDDFQTEVELHSPKKTYKKKNLNVVEHLRTPQKSKPLHKSKREKIFTDLEVCNMSEQKLKIKFKTKNAPEKLNILLTGSAKNPVDTLRSKNEGETMCYLEVTNLEKQFEVADSSNLKLPSSNEKPNSEPEQKLSNASVSKGKNLTRISKLHKLSKKNSKSENVSNTAITVYGNEVSDVTNIQNTACLKSKKMGKCTSDLVSNKRQKRNIKTHSPVKNVPLHEKDQKVISPKHKQQNLELSDLAENHLQNNSSKTKTVSPGDQVDISFEKNVSVLESNADINVKESNIHQQNNIKSGRMCKKIVTSPQKKSSGAEILSLNEKLSTESEQKLSNGTVNINEEKSFSGVSELNKLPEKYSKSDNLSNTAITLCEYDLSNVTDKQNNACLKSKKKQKCTSDLVLNKRSKRNLKSDSATKNIQSNGKDQKLISPKHEQQNLELSDFVENHLKNDSSKSKTESSVDQIDISLEKSVSVLESNADTSVSSVEESNIHQQKNIKSGSMCKRTVKSPQKNTAAVLSDAEILSPNKKLNAELEQKLSKEAVNINEEKCFSRVSELNKLPEEHSKSDNLSLTTTTLCEYDSSNVTDKQNNACLKSKKKQKCTSDLVLNKRSKRNLKSDSATKNIQLNEKGPKLISPKHKQQNIDLSDFVENNLKNDSSKSKPVSPETQFDISFQNNVSVKESNSNTSVSLDMESYTHPQNVKTGSPFKTAVREETVTLSNKKPKSFEDCLAYLVVNENKKNKKNVPPKKSKEGVKSSKNVSKIKISGKQVNESSKSLPDWMALSDIHKKESNCKIKHSNKINKNVESSLEKSIDEQDATMTSSQSFNSNSISKDLQEKDFMDITDSDPSNENIIKVKSMTHELKNSNKEITEKATSDIRYSKDLKNESLFKSPYAKLTIANNSKFQCSTSQASYFDDTVSLKSVGRTSTVILMEDDYLDFEPDQSDVGFICDDEFSCSDIDEIGEALVSEPDLASNSPKITNFEELESSIAYKDNTVKEPDSILPTNDCKSFTDPCNSSFGCNYSPLVGKDLISEEDTDSDDEHSFKRTHSERKDNDGNETSLNYVDLNNWEESDAIQTEVLQEESEQNIPNEICHTPVSSAESESLKSSCEDKVISLNSDQINLKSKEPAGSVAHFTNVLSQIQDLCFKGSLNEVLEVVKTYFSISSSDINQLILRNLLVNTFSFISKSDKRDNSFVIVFEKILELMNRFNICNKKIASYFITNCCLYPDLNIYSIKLFHVCHKENIPLNTKAVRALSLLCSTSENNLAEDITFDLMLDFMNYTKLICKKHICKELLHLALKKCEIFDLPFSDIHHICSLLHGITSKEVDGHNLKEFILFIFNKSMWQHVAEMFIAWGTKNHLSICIYTALTTDYKTMGKFFKKFASYVHEKEENLSPELKATFGQMGTALMLYAFSKNAMDIALDILYILHAYNVNYFELQLSMSSSFLTQSNLEAENYSFKTFPFSVVFTAIDICLHLNRPLDAFTIFQDYSWIVPDESLDEAVKIYVIKEKCQRLLKLVSFLNHEDLLDKGFESLQNLLTIVKQDFAYEILKEYVCDLVSIYNEYLVSLMNAGKLSSLYILYENSFGPHKDIFTIFPDVLRGLVVIFSEDGRDTVANSLFLMGIMKKIYPLQKPKLEHFPWEITLITHWTITEIKLAVEWFIEDLFSILMEKPLETHFENWFSVKIVFDVKDQNSDDLKCLKDTISESKYYITKTRSALENMNPNLEVTEDVNENTLYIKSNSLYNFWKSRCSDQALKFISVDVKFLKANGTFSFGNNRNNSKERESSIFVKTFLNETCSLSKPSDKMIEPQNLIQCSQSPSPSKWKNTSATDVYEMIHEIKAKTPPSTYVATTPERSPSSQNSVHNISQSERLWFSGPILGRNNQIDEFHYSPRSPTVPPNQLTEGYYTSNSQQASDVNQSVANNDATNNSSHFQSPFTPCSPNTSPRASNTPCNYLSDFKNKESLSINSNEKNGSSSSSSISILKTAVATSQPLASSKKVSLLRSRTTSVNKTPVTVKKIATIKKGKILKANNSSKKFQNFKVCITPGDRTVSSPSNQTSRAELQSVKSNLEKSIVTDSQEKPCSSVNEDKPVPDTPCKQILPVVSQTTQIEAERVSVNFTDAGSSNLFSGNVSDSRKALIKLPVSKVKEHRLELNKLPVATQSTKSPVQSVTSVPKSKFVKTVNLKNVTNDKFSTVSINTSLQNCVKAKPNSKPVINRNSTYCSSISKTSPSVTSNDKIASVASSSGRTVTAVNGNEKIVIKKQSLNGNKVFTNCTPVIGLPTWNKEESKKVFQFLKSKVAFKNKDLSPVDQNKKVLSLIHAFIKSNEGITVLNNRTKKLLMEFAEKHA